MATVVYEGIHKNFGKVQALQDINVEVKAGKFVALLGPSGCGKSTLLRLTAGLETISAGNLFIDGKLVNRVHPRDRDMVSEATPTCSPCNVLGFTSLKNISI
ncbi:MAG: ATP-binding cassette domain-containing protein [Desulfobacterales bacterium]